jgi:hypothetical protein
LQFALPPFGGILFQVVMMPGASFETDLQPKTIWRTRFDRSPGNFSKCRLAGPKLREPFAGPASQALRRGGMDFRQGGNPCRW